MSTASSWGSSSGSMSPADAYGAERAGESERRRRSALFPYLGGRGFLPLITLGLMSAATAVFYLVLVLHRGSLVIDLALKPVEVDRLLACVVGLGALGALIAATPHKVRGLRAAIQLGGLAVAATFVALGVVNEATPLRVLLGVAGVAVGIVWALTRTVALDICGSTGGWRIVALPWAGAALGVAVVAGYEYSVEQANWGYVLAGAGVVCFLVTAIIPPVRGRDVVAVHRRGSTPARAPLLLTAFMLGVSTIGVAPTAVVLLVTKWEFDAAEVGGVILLCAVAAMTVAGIGHWFTRSAERTSAHLASAAQVLAVATAGLTALGAASLTEVGALFCWAGAAVAAILFAVSAETALLTGQRPASRAATSALLVLAASLGGAVGIFTITFVTGVTRGWLIAAAAAPAAIVSIMSLVAEPRPGAIRVVEPEITGPIDGGALDPLIPIPVGLGTIGRPRPLLVCTGLDVAYDNVQVLFGVDLCVEAEQVVALLGTNGAGKTTLLRAIAGLERQRAGSIIFGGADISTFDPTWRVGLGINQIAGGQALAEDLTVAENLRLFGYSLGRHRTSLHQGIDRALGVFPRLEDRRNQPASTLSGGEKQMLALSKALILRPKLLIIDEFSLGLAPKVVGELLPIVSELNAGGSAVLLVEQSVNIALSIADHAYCMEKGEIVYDGSAERLRDDPELMRAVYLEGVSKALSA